MALFGPTKKPSIKKDNNLYLDKTKAQNKPNLGGYKESFVYCVSKEKRFGYVINAKGNFRMLDNFVVSLSDDKVALELYAIHHSIEVLNHLGGKEVTIYSKYYDFEKITNIANENNTYTSYIAKRTLELINEYDLVKFKQECPYEDIIKLGERILSI